MLGSVMKLNQQKHGVVNQKHCGSSSGSVSRVEPIGGRAETCCVWFTVRKSSNVTCCCSSSLSCWFDSFLHYVFQKHVEEPFCDVFTSSLLVKYLLVVCCPVYISCGFSSTPFYKCFPENRLLSEFDGAVAHPFDRASLTDTEPSAQQSPREHE